MGAARRKLRRAVGEIRGWACAGRGVCRCSRGPRGLERGQVSQPARWDAADTYLSWLWQNECRSRIPSGTPVASQCTPYFPEQTNHSRRPTDNANPTSPPNQPLRNPFPKRRTRRIPMHQHNFPPTLRAPLIDPHAPMRSLDISSTRIVIRWVRQSGDFVRGEMGDLCR
jgi:hypothetical protein